MTRPMSSAATTSRTWTSPVSRSTSTLGDAGRPAERRVGVAAVGRRRRSRRPDTARTLVDAQRAVVAGVVAVGRRANVPPVAASTSVAQPPGRLDQQAADDHRRPRRDGRARSRARTRCPAARARPSSYGTPSASATSCGKIVLVPCPISVEAVRMRIAAVGGQLERGDRRELDLARAGEPGAVPGEREADARWRSARGRSAAASRAWSRSRRAAPRAVACRARSRSNSAASAARSRTSSPATLSRRTWPVGVVSPGTVDVPAPDLERADAERLGDPVEVGLGRELGLRRPEPAERAVGRRVRARRPGADADVRAAVRAAGVERAARQDDRRQRAVRAAVHDDLDVLGDEPAVAGHARSGGGRSPGGAWSSRRCPRGGRRSSAPAAGPCRASSAACSADDRRELLLAAEPAAGLGLDDPRLRVVDAEAALERRVDVVRALERAVDGDAAVLASGRRSSRCSRCRAAPGGRPGTRPRGRGRRPRSAASRSPRLDARRPRTRGRTRAGRRPAGAASVRGRAPACRAARSVARSGAARRASGSAWCWISPPTGTRIGWSALIELTMLSPGMSAAVTTTTVDQSKAGSSSRATNVACASVERIVAPYQAPGKTRSSAYLAAPVSLAGPSRRSGAAAAGASGRDRAGLDDDGAGAARSGSSNRARAVLHGD